MVHRLIVGARAAEAAIAAYNAGLSYKGTSPMDLAPFFVNTVRVFSNLDVFDGPQRDQFDAQLVEVGIPFGGIVVRPDQGAQLRVIGRPLVQVSTE